MADQDNTLSTSNLRFPEWQLAYQAALLEVDPQKLPERVKTAECYLPAATSDGPQFRRTCGAASHRRRHAAPTVIQTEKLGYPD